MRAFRLGLGLFFTGWLLLSCNLLTDIIGWDSNTPPSLPTGDGEISVTLSVTAAGMVVDEAHPIYLLIFDMEDTGSGPMDYRSVTNNGETITFGELPAETVLGAFYDPQGLWSDFSSGPTEGMLIEFWNDRTYADVMYNGMPEIIYTSSGAGGVYILELDERNIFSTMNLLNTTPGPFDVSVYAASAYTLPASYTWGDYLSVDFSITVRNEGDYINPYDYELWVRVIAYNSPDASISELLAYGNVLGSTYDDSGLSNWETRNYYLDYIDIGSTGTAGAYNYFYAVTYLRDYYTGDIFLPEVYSDADNSLLLNGGAGVEVLAPSYAHDSWTWPPPWREAAITRRRLIWAISRTGIRIVSTPPKPSGMQWM